MKTGNTRKKRADKRDQYNKRKIKNKNNLKKEDRHDVKRKLKIKK